MSAVTVMPLSSKTYQPGPTIYYDDGFRNTLEDFMSILRVHPTTGIITPDPIRFIQYQFDFSGLIALFGVKPEHYWITMRMNNLKSPMDDITGMTEFLVPDATFIGKIAQSYQTKKRITLS